MRVAHRFYRTVAVVLVTASLAAFGLAISRPGDSDSAAARAASLARTHASVLASLDDPLDGYRHASRSAQPILHRLI